MLICSGWYGGLAWKYNHTSPFWHCADSESSWIGVIDDFGTIVPVSGFTNHRGY